MDFKKIAAQILKTFYKDVHSDLILLGDKVKKITENKYPVEILIHLKDGQIITKKLNYELNIEMVINEMSTQ